MKKKMLFAKIFASFYALIAIFSATPASAMYSYHANGGTYYNGNGYSYNRVPNDGYCVSGRGPCSSNLWNFDWSYNNGGCGATKNASWKMAKVLNATGKITAWIDSGPGGTMYGADYSVVYNGASVSYSSVNQNAYGEQFVPITQVFKPSITWLSNGWSMNYICNSKSGLRVEFDEVRLDI